jgi:hypothetical protein
LVFTIETRITIVVKLRLCDGTQTNCVTWFVWLQLIGSEESKDHEDSENSENSDDCEDNGDTLTEAERAELDTSFFYSEEAFKQYFSEHRELMRIFLTQYNKDYNLHNLLYHTPMF